MRLEDLGLIGNCQCSALVSRTGDIVWSCLPRFDSAPIFSRLLDAQRGGGFQIGPPGGEAGAQRYLPNTNVLETTFQTPDGAFRVLDFAPRFLLYDRSFRPTQLYRIIEPISGTPRIRFQCDPRLGWSRETPPQTQGSHHVQFGGFPGQVRLTTDVPLSYLDGRPFALTERRHAVLTWGAPVEEPLPALCDRFLNETVRYWQRWVKHCNVPPLFQQEVIRSALALKLHCFEDTGAIIAATTTSIPESAGSGRTWDYRYCWMRDSYYTLGAFRLLGHFEEREQFTQYLFNVASSSPTLDLNPLYRIDGGADLDEHILTDWPGYEQEQPVRIGNGAATQLQNDIFGEMVMSLAPVFLDDRFEHDRTPQALELIERLARKAIAVAGTPDAGIWEHRTEPRPQTFSSLMCWAAADRMARIGERRGLSRTGEYRAAAERIREEVLVKAWSAERDSLVSTYGGSDLDAALLQMAPLHFLPPRDPRLRATVDAIWKDLGTDGWLYRYKSNDGFGKPTVAFTICTFWFVEALARIGRLEEARQVFERARAALSPLGLISEDYDTVGKRMWGNFPQAYSHVGLIHAAFEASPRWADVL